MKPYVHQSFWSDPDIEKQSPEIKLAALWLITNSQTSIIGICESSGRRFAFETGLDKEALQRACEALPRAFKKIGDAIFIVNFIRHQFGAGDSLIRNNFFKALSSAFLGQSEDVQEEILREYPEFSEALAKGFKGLHKPKDRIGKERIGKEEGSAEGRSNVSTNIPDQLKEVSEFVKTWEEFKNHRKKLRKPMTPRAEELILKTLSERPQQALNAIALSIRKGWQDINWQWFDNSMRNGSAQERQACHESGRYQLSQEEQPKSWNPMEEQE